MKERRRKSHVCGGTGRRRLEESSTEEGRSHVDKAHEASNAVPVSPTGLGGRGSTGWLASGGLVLPRLRLSPVGAENQPLCKPSHWQPSRTLTDNYMT